MGFAAKTLGHAAKIFVPEVAGPAKIALIRAQGAELEVVSGPVMGAFAAAEDYAQRTGAMQVHPFDAPDTLAGQGTLMREWEAQGLEADTVLIAVGGGGLIGGPWVGFKGGARWWRSNRCWPRRCMLPCRPGSRCRWCHRGLRQVRWVHR